MQDEVYFRGLRPHSKFSALLRLYKKGKPPPPLLSFFHSLLYHTFPYACRNFPFSTDEIPLYQSGVSRRHSVLNYILNCKGIDKVEAKELSQAPGEVYAAISMALHEMQDEVHDVEETVLTITRVKRSYSPWSSKIYTLRENPNRK